MRDIQVKLFGWWGLIIQGDLFVIDRWRFVRRVLRRGPVRTLDAGAGNGAFTMYARRQGNEDVIGLNFNDEANASAIRRAKILGVEGVDFRGVDLRELDRVAPELGQFDQVICLETIEHIKDSAKLIRDLASVMRPGAQLILTTPNIEHRPMWYDEVFDVENGGHVRYGYSHAELRELCEAAGLTVNQEVELSGVVPQRITYFMGWLGTRLKLSWPVLWLVTLPLRVLHVLDKPLTRLTRYPGVSVGIVATRNR
jgi:2-polyprenyl-3-methyl-5-hydroxy-6-metoxy-1,4-benzoquinol methylase